MDEDRCEFTQENGGLVGEGAFFDKGRYGFGSAKCFVTATTDGATIHLAQPNV